MPQLNNIPPERVGEIVQSFVNEGRTDVRAEKQPDGSWKITAT